MLKKILMISLLLLVSALSVGLKTSDAAEITAIRSSRQKDALGQINLRIVLDVTGPVIPTSEYVEGKRPELRVNIPNSSLGVNRGRVPSISSNKIDRVELRTAGKDGSQMRIRLKDELPSDSFKVFMLKKDPENNKPDRIVIDICENKMQKTFSADIKGKVIVIDPGHGGSDPGAIGLNKTREKEVTLAVSTKVRDLLIAKGAKVQMTRVTDTDVHSAGATDIQELQARVNVGSKVTADIFVSIHSNASVNRDVGGISTYYTPKTNFDTVLAQCLQDELMKNASLTDLGIRQAGFYVTKRSAMPAALIELAFLSNPTEEKLLSSPWFQEKAAVAIVAGIEKYFSTTFKQGGAK